MMMNIMSASSIRAMIFSWCRKHQERIDIKLVSTFLLHAHVSVMCLHCFVLLDWIVLVGGEQFSSLVYARAFSFECPFSGALVRTMKNAAHGNWRAQVQTAWQRRAGRSKEPRWLLEHAARARLVPRMPKSAARSRMAATAPRASDNFRQTAATAIS